MGDQESKDLVRRFYAEAINERDPTACERLLTEGFVHNEEARGRAGQAETVAYFLRAFPDLHNSIELLMCEGDLVCAHQRWRGTQEGEFLGVKGTGRIVDFTSTAILRIEDDLIAQAWDVIDTSWLQPNP
jgi:predicted ester cyclase